VLNWAARYFPILRMLNPHLPPGSRLLEIGAGSIGIGKFRRVPFIGCDIEFPFPPKAPMLPVIASAMRLPFGDRFFEGVVVSDVLEHVPPPHRLAVIHEALRVARKIAIFGFPSGIAGFEYDQKLAETYDRSRQQRPQWLQEHLQHHPYPTTDLFEGLDPTWTVSCLDNENVTFHNWVMRQEMSRIGIYTFMLLLAVQPRPIEYLLRKADHPPFYRKIVILQRCQEKV